MIKLAIDRYDRHMPLFDGTVDLVKQRHIHVLQVGQTSALRDGTDRHERMLRDQEFDAAETSLASYLVARSLNLPFTAIPVFPRRLFSQGQIFVNTKAGINSPKDLEGKAVGLQSFQTTLAVLAKGDLATEYGVSLESIQWRVAAADTVEVPNFSSYDISVLPYGTNLPSLLCLGEIDALFYSRTPQLPTSMSQNFRRLFRDSQRKELQFFERNGYWPIMHLIIIKNDALDLHPDLPIELFRLFNASYRLSLDYFSDPNWTRLALGKFVVEEDQTTFGQDLWRNGIAANKKNLDRFVGYAYDQGLIERKLDITDLFHESVMNT